MYCPTGIYGRGKGIGWNSQEPVRSSIDLSIIKRFALAINKAGLSGNGFQSDRANRKHAQEPKSESISD